MLASDLLILSAEERYALGPDRISFSVQDGEVTLSGFVRIDNGQCRRAERNHRAIERDDL